MKKFENYLNENITFYRNNPDDGIVILDKNRAKYTYYSKQNNFGKTEYFIKKKDGSSQKITSLDYYIARDGLVKYISKNPDAKNNPIIKNKLYLYNKNREIVNNNPKNNLLSYLNGNAVSKFNTDFINKLNSYFVKLPENMKKLFKKFGKKIIILDANYIPKNKQRANGSYDYIKNTIYFNQDDKVMNPCSLLFHESGHFINANISQTDDNHEKCYSFESPLGKKFTQSIVDETYKNLNERKKSFMDLTLDEYCKKYNLNFTNKNYVTKDYESLRQICKAIESGKYSKDILSDKDLDNILLLLFTKELNDLKCSSTTIGILQDMFSMSTKGNPNFGGHNKKYAETHGGNSNYTSDEAFAELTEISCTYKNELDTVKKYFPNSVKMYNDMVEEICK